jgi:hypothetical protein
MSSKAFTSTVTQHITKTITSYDVEITRLMLFSSVDLLVTLKDENGDYVGHRMYKIEGQEYSGWSTDDAYIMTCIETRLRADPNLTFA